MTAAVVRAVFLDVGGTLLKPWPSVGSVYSQIGGRYGFSAGAEAMDHAFREAWKALETPACPGSLTTSNKNWWRELVFKTLEVQELRGEAGQKLLYFEELYRVFADPKSWRVFPDASDAIRELKARGIHVGVISNWDERLRPLLGGVGLNQQLDSMTISCEVGAEKPDRRIFQAALISAGVSPSEAMHVGDSYEQDVLGAHDAGLRALLLDRQGKGGHDCPCIRNLREIVSALEG